MHLFLLAAARAKPVDPRAALQSTLWRKQRQAGNRWLACELGYVLEMDHLKDCLAATEAKRQAVIKMEQERVQANERKKLREQMFGEYGEDEMFGNDDEVDDEYQPEGAVRDHAEGEIEEEDNEDEESSWLERLSNSKEAYLRMTKQSHCHLRHRRKLRKVLL